MLLTRSIAILPTFCVAFFSDIEDLTDINDILNAFMSVLLPFAVIPAVSFASHRLIMGRHKTGGLMMWFCAGFSVAVIGINTYFMADFVQEDMPQEWYVFAGMALLAVFYFALIAYLLVYMFICMGWESLCEVGWVRKYYWVEDFINDNEKRRRAEIKA